MEQRRVLELELARLKEDLATVTERSDEALAQWVTTPPGSISSDPVSLVLSEDFPAATERALELTRRRSQP